MNGRYILNANGEPVLCEDLIAWAHWFQTSNRRVKADEVGQSFVSTIFLGFDHSHEPSVPILWETLVFGGPLNGEMDRCSGSREQAEAMHVRMVRRVKMGVMP